MSRAGARGLAATYEPGVESAALRIRDSADSDLRTIQAIYAHHVLHGSASFELEPPDLAEIAPLAQPQTFQCQPFQLAQAAGQHHVAACWATGGSHDPFAGQQTHQCGPLGHAPHHRQIGFVDGQSQHPARAAGHHQLLVFAAGHHPLQLHPFLEFEDGGGPTGKFQEFFLLNLVLGRC